MNNKSEGHGGLVLAPETPRDPSTVRRETTASRRL